MVKLWSTPKTSDVNGPREHDGKRGVGLNTEVTEQAWPTPAARDHKGQNGRPSHLDQLPNFVKFLWPTATKTDGKGSRRATARMEKWQSEEGTTLTDAALACGDAYPTPTRSRYGRNKGGMSSEGPKRPSLELAASRGQLPSPQDPASSISGPGSSQSGQSSLRLNPTFVEWLMGFPCGLTDFAPWVTRSSRNKQPEPSSSSGSGSGSTSPPESPSPPSCSFCSDTGLCDRCMGNGHIDSFREFYEEHEEPEECPSCLGAGFCHCDAGREAYEKYEDELYSL